MTYITKAEDIKLNNEASRFTTDNLNTEVNGLFDGQTAANLLTKIKTVDGTGSGLDADLLDGAQGSDYAKLASPTFTGTVSLPSTTSIGNVSSTELGYLDGVTSALQTQLNNKSETTHLHTDIYEPASSNIQTHIASTSNPHGVTAGQVGLGNVTNESKATMFTSPTFTGTVALNGGQIRFPATQVPSSDANTLDDYEEGTFTPTTLGETTAGVGTYNAQEASYVKIGKLVYFSIYVSTTNHTGSGNYLIGGLPFIARNQCSATIGYCLFLTYSGTLGAWIMRDSSRIVLLNTVSGANYSATQLDATSSIMLSGCYVTD